ncbi:HAD-IIA family hydrolase [endosymbiont of unidentified scaly snail isolate Monju]|uniref:HAD-IIA family hydrolase n=1 Tax=endosymbiont of unidentified scaly snail isolate Monju TaxID=1248727 RepID=UPI0003892AAD|nr:HAD-IIA family hydrolase [endosymbiont of unidentified scaly snail isolate Monju]BAN69270.1 4-nitrophenyl phosphatase [endosymbiont of unidentified scaly snail isolate Monju]
MGFRPRGLLLDMDGVLYHGSRLLPHARRFLEATAHLPRVFVTNNPIRTPVEVADHLAALGLPRSDPADVLTSGVATARWLARERPGFRFFAVGADGLHRVLAEHGTEDAENAEFVVVGEGPGLDYDTLSRGIDLIRNGATLVSTNPDPSVDAVVAGRHRVLPGGGALVAPFEVATGLRATTIGKPEPLLFVMALERLGLSAAECVMVGDRPDTDIAGAARVGLRCALVRTGRFLPGASWPAGEPPPDWDVPDLRSLLLRWWRDGVLEQR